MKDFVSKIKEFEFCRDWFVLNFEKIILVLQKIKGSERKGMRLVENLKHKSTQLPMRTWAQAMAAETERGGIC